jgi:hypothetical protein
MHEKPPSATLIWAGKKSPGGMFAVQSLILSLAILVKLGGHRGLLEHHAVHNAGIEGGAVDRCGEPRIVGYPV